MDFGMPTLIENKNLEETVSLCKELGLQFIELNMNFPMYQVPQLEETAYLKELAQKINELGLEFGFWIEPEMVNPDSDLYRAHPDWAFAVPGRTPALGRHQYVLDFSRYEVVDLYIIHI